jgi:hypothetical protein
LRNTHSCHAKHAIIKEKKMNKEKNKRKDAREGKQRRKTGRGGVYGYDIGAEKGQAVGMLCALHT